MPAEEDAKENYGFRKLQAWREADQLAHAIYRATRGFPKDELFGLTVQLRRASISVASNLVEGQARKGRAEFKHFVSMALGSLAEVEYLLDFAHKEDLIDIDRYGELEGIRHRAGSLLWKLYQSLNTPKLTAYRKKDDVIE